jgi:hypothetical protein
MRISSVQSSILTTWMISGPNSGAPYEWWGQVKGADIIWAPGCARMFGHPGAHVSVAKVWQQVDYL